MSAHASQSTAVEWLEAIEAEGLNLTPWETQFVESLRNYVNRGGWLSENHTLERIYAERTP